MEKTNTKITRYKDGEFFIDVVEDGDIIDVWLSHKKYGTSEHMFGLPLKQPETDKLLTMDDVLQIIENNLETYKAKYFDDAEEDSVWD